LRPAAARSAAAFL